MRKDNECSDEGDDDGDGGDDLASWAGGASADAVPHGGGRLAATSEVAAAGTSSPSYPWVERYIEENHPDPICVKQMRKWKFEWREKQQQQQHQQAQLPEVDGDKDNGGAIDDDSSDNQLQQEQQQRQKPPQRQCSWSSRQVAVVVWRGEYGAVTLESSCEWTTHEFHCEVRAKAELFNDVSRSAELVCKNSSNREEARPRTRKLMAERLANDDYVKRLLLATPSRRPCVVASDPANPSNDTYKGADGTTFTAGATAREDGKEEEAANGDDRSSDSTGTLLCEAHIVASSDGLSASAAGPVGSPPAAPRAREERYHTAEDVAEGIKRCVWSSAEASTDVIHFVVQYLPLLPVATTTGGGEETTAAGTTTTKAITTPLADRAQLRLLEDALVDACERQSQEEMVQDLEIAEEDEEPGMGEDKGQRAQPPSRQALDGTHSSSTSRTSNSRRAKKSRRRYR
jgi:hypothetical protein